MKEKGNQYRLSVIRAAYQEYRCYGSHRSLYHMADITSEQMRFRAVQLKGQGDDC